VCIDASVIIRPAAIAGRDKIGNLHTNNLLCVANLLYILSFYKGEVYQKIIKLKIKLKSCLIWTSLCMLFEVVTIDLHYMTDRKERFDLKISK